MVEKGYLAYPEDVRECINKLRPGLSGIGSVIFRDEEFYISQTEDPIKYYNEKIQPVKGNLEKWYFHNKSLYVDFMIIFLTCWVILFPKSDLVNKIFRNLPKFNH